MSWIPGDKMTSILRDQWPGTLSEMTKWVVEEAPSTYALLYAREIVETLIRFEAHDATAMRNILDSTEILQEDAGEHIDVKMDALTALNRRISALGLEQPVDVTPYLTEQSEGPASRST